MLEEEKRHLLRRKVLTVDGEYVGRVIGLILEESEAEIIGLKLRGKTGLKTLSMQIL